MNPKNDLQPENNIPLCNPFVNGNLMVNQFCFKLRELGLNPIIEGDFLNLEYGYEPVLQKATVKLINQFVGFWRSIGIETNHSREEKIARYKIRLSWISGKDLTKEQLFTIAGRIGQRMRGNRI